MLMIRRLEKTNQLKQRMNLNNSKKVVARCSRQQQSLNQLGHASGMFKTSKESHKEAKVADDKCK